MDNSSIFIISLCVGIAVAIYYIHTSNTNTEKFTTNNLGRMVQEERVARRKVMNSLSDTPIHPSMMSTQELEEYAEKMGLGVGPGMVEGDRFRGNLNL
jgi:hypothetical protein